MVAYVVCWQSSSMRAHNYSLLCDAIKANGTRRVPVPPMAVDDTQFSLVSIPQCLYHFCKGRIMLE